MYSIKLEFDSVWRLKTHYNSKLKHIDLLVDTKKEVRQTQPNFNSILSKFVTNNTVVFGFISMPYALYCWNTLRTKTF